MKGKTYLTQPSQTLSSLIILLREVLADVRRGRLQSLERIMTEFEPLF